MAVLVVCLSWLCVSVGVLLGFIFLHFGVLPIPIKHLYLFGKLRKKGDVSILSYVDVPKRWFLHFYIIGLVCNTCALVILTDVWREYLPISSDQILQLLHLRKGDVSGEPSPVMPVLLVLVLEELQILRRLYENMSVSVFSESKMSMIHYFTGVLLYATFSISLLAELVARQKIPAGVNWAISLPEWSGIGLFLWAWYKQFKLTGLLAKLRKTAKGAVANLSHHKPRGDLFEWVSCPHFLMEILIYLSFCLITRFQSPTVLSVTCFVIVNQTISAVMTHKWYRASLRQYPAHRKAIVPYLL